MGDLRAAPDVADGVVGEDELVHQEEIPGHDFVLHRAGGHLERSQDETVEDQEGPDDDPQFPEERPDLPSRVRGGRLHRFLICC